MDKILEKNQTNPGSLNLRLNNLYRKYNKFKKKSFQQKFKKNISQKIEQFSQKLYLNTIKTTNNLLNYEEIVNNNEAFFRIKSEQKRRQISQIFLDLQNKIANTIQVKQYKSKRQLSKRQLSSKISNRQKHFHFNSRPQSPKNQIDLSNKRIIKTSNIIIPRNKISRFMKKIITIHKQYPSQKLCIITIKNSIFFQIEILVQDQYYKTIVKNQKWKIFQQFLNVILDFMNAFDIRTTLKLKFDENDQNFYFTSSFIEKLMYNREQAKTVIQQIRKMENLDDLFNQQAIKIQRIYKGYRTKQKFKKIKYIYKQILRIQNFFRKQLKKIALKKKYRQQSLKQYQKFKIILNKFKKDFEKIIAMDHIEIHIVSNCKEVSSSYQEETKLTTQKYQSLLNAQISRVFRVKDPLKRIIYISEIALDSQIKNYYYDVFFGYQLLRAKGIQSSRLIFLQFQNEHQSIKKLQFLLKVYYLLDNKLKILLKLMNKPAYIIPSQNNKMIIKIANSLNIGVYCNPAQNIHLKYLSPKRIVDLYDRKDILYSLSKLIVQNPQTNVWIFKIYNESRSRGLAKFFMKSLNKKKIEKIQSQKQILSLNQQLDILLQKNLSPVINTLYFSSQQYLSKLYHYGGMIQLCPQQIIGNLKSYIIFGQLRPNGKFIMICILRKIQQQLRSLGVIKIEQQQIENLDSIINQAVSQIKCKSNYFGFLKLQLIKCDTNIFIIDCKFYLDPQCCSFFFYQFINTNNFQYCFFPIIIHQSIRNFYIKSFFKLSNFYNLKLDFLRESGICFLLYDMIQSGIIGTIVIQSNEQLLQNELQKLMNFLKKLKKKKNKNMIRIQDSRSDILQFSFIVSKIKQIFNKKY